jgi:class 3 adenylate cyclase/tetratricopeptide (TPR) repeat protein/tRNA A-37 threonylcarbamoyl transferase component Bud32
VTKARTVSHYQIVDQLGAGAMGVVYKARDTKLDRFVAIKFLSPHLAESDDAKRRFVAEAKAASALDHPNIGVIHEIGESDGGLFIVMGYYPGETLQQRLRHGPLAPSLALEIAIQVAGGLARAHERGIVHRDVKPANILLTEEGVPKILDFGLAKVANLSSTAPGAAVGTPSYMAPEQVLGQPVDARTDVWALGTVLYEMLTASVPFRAQSHHALFNAIVDDEPVIPSFAPSGVEEILRKALAKEPAHRYPSMGALIGDLERACAEASSASVLETQLKVTTRRPRADAEGSSSERRFLTVLSAQLDDYARLAEELDPEDLLAVLRRYQEVCRDVLTRFSAHVVEQEEGVVLGYFGYPLAREDDSRRSVEAASAIHDELRSVTPTRSARIGIHTGSVVVTDSQSGSPIVGPVPGQASRIRDAATPGEIALSADTFRLVRDWFEGELVSGREIYRVDRASPSEARRGAEHPLVGRRRELEFLVDRWEKAREGLGSAVLLSGEAGIGKSRLVRALLERIGSEPRRFEARCSPYYSATPLHPIAHVLESALGIEGAMGFDGLRRKLSPLGLVGAEEAVSVASLLSIEVPESFPRPTLTPERQKRVTFQAVVEVLLQKPVVLVVEDIHWADATTLELLGVLIEQSTAAPILTLMTGRSEFVPDWPARSLTQLQLSRLSHTEVEALVSSLVAGRAIEPGLAAKVAQRTDGVPLFVEELTKSLVETENGESIPATLLESLAARLDRLGPAKSVAQVGAVLGREFSLDLIRALAELDEPELGRHLDRLVRAELLLQKGVGSRAAYTFKHALIQQAAYESLLKSARQKLHRRAATLLENELRAMGESHPELLAHHLAEGDSPEGAIDLWLRAAHRALGRSALAEAQTLLERGLDRLGQIVPGEPRDRRELLLRMTLGPVLTARTGYGSSEVEAEHLRAVELARTVGDDMQRFWVPHGIWSVYFVRGQLSRAAEFADQVLAHAARLGHPALRYEAHYAVGGTAFFRGQLDVARDHFEKGLALDSPDLDRSLVLYAHGLDTGVKTLGLYGQLLFQLGRSDDGLARAEESLALAEKLDHPFSRALALYWVAWLHLLRGNVPKAREFCERLIEVSSREAFFFTMLAKVVEGWCLAREGDEKGIALMEETLRLRALGGDRLGRTQYMALLAEAQLAAGRLEDARASLTDALRTMRRGGERLWESALGRLRREASRPSRLRGEQRV